MGKKRTKRPILAKRSQKDGFGRQKLPFSVSESHWGPKRPEKAQKAENGPGEPKGARIEAEKSPGETRPTSPKEKKLLRALQKAIMVWGGRLELAGWFSRLEMSDLAGARYPREAQVSTTIPHREFLLEVSPDLQLSQVEEVVVHELLHVVFAPAYDVVKNLLDGLVVDDRARVGMLYAYMDAEERVVCSLARILMDLSPETEPKESVLPLALVPVSPSPPVQEEEVPK